MSEVAQHPHGLMLCDDLIFFSRVEGAAHAAGLALRMVRTPASLVNAVRHAVPGGIILDVHTENMDLPALLAELRTVCDPVPPITGFGSHVEAAVLRAARQAGCDRVLPRSQFVEDLNSKIAFWLGAPANG